MDGRSMRFAVFGHIGGPDIEHMSCDFSEVHITAQNKCAFQLHRDKLVPLNWNSQICKKRQIHRSLGDRIFATLYLV
jgi:hypothetical protein